MAECTGQKPQAPPNYEYKCDTLSGRWVGPYPTFVQTPQRTAPGPAPGSTDESEYRQTAGTAGETAPVEGVHGGDVAAGGKSQKQRCEEGGTRVWRNGNCWSKAEWGCVENPNRKWVDVGGGRMGCRDSDWQPRQETRQQPAQRPAAGGGGGGYTPTQAGPVDTSYGYQPATGYQPAQVQQADSAAAYRQAAGQQGGQPSWLTDPGPERREWQGPGGDRPQPIVMPDGTVIQWQSPEEQARRQEREALPTAQDARSMAMEHFASLPTYDPMEGRPDEYQPISMGDVLEDPRYIEAARAQDEAVRRQASAAGIRGAGLLTGLAGGRQNLLTGLHERLGAEGRQQHEMEMARWRELQSGRRAQWQQAYQPLAASLGYGLQAEGQRHGQWMGEQGLGLQRGEQQFRHAFQPFALGERLGAQERMQRAGFGHQAGMQSRQFGHDVGMQAGAQAFGREQTGRQFAHQAGMQQAQFGHQAGMQQAGFQHQVGQQARQFAHQAGMQGSAQAAADRRMRQGLGYNLFGQIMNQPAPMMGNPFLG